MEAALLEQQEQAAELRAELAAAWRRAQSPLKACMGVQVRACMFPALQLAGSLFAALDDALTVGFGRLIYPLSSGGAQKMCSSCWWIGAGR